MKNYMPATLNLEEIDQFLEIYNKAKMKKEEIRNLNTQITSREIESAIKNLPTGDAYINRIEWKAVTRYKPVTRGSLGGAAVWRLPLAQGAILETRDRIPRLAPAAWSLLLPLPVSLPLSLSLS